MVSNQGDADFLHLMKVLRFIYYAIIIVFLQYCILYICFSQYIIIYSITTPTTRGSLVPGHLSHNRACMQYLHRTPPRIAPFQTGKYVSSTNTATFPQLNVHPQQLIPPENLLKHWSFATTIFHQSVQLCRMALTM